jgi:hypothetical protein
LAKALPAMWELKPMDINKRVVLYVQARRKRELFNDITFNITADHYHKKEFAYVSL